MTALFSLDGCDHMTNKKFPMFPVVLVAIVVLLIVLAAKLGRTTDSTQQDSTLTPGLNYLQELEEKSPDNVERIIKEYRQQELLAQREARLAQLESGEISVWSLFDDYALLGDSRAVGFEYYDYLDPNRVMAEAGATILALQEHIPDIVALNPSYLFLCYGLNDVSIGIWPTPEDYVAEYSAIIDEIRAQLPDVKIFISSILPARDPALSKSSAWYNIPEYSAAVAEMCNSNGCVYVDNDDISEEHADLWEVDGIHLLYTFYPYWGTNLIMAVYDYEVALSEGDSSTGS